MTLPVAGPAACSSLLVPLLVARLHLGRCAGGGRAASATRACRSSAPPARIGALAPAPAVRAVRRWRSRRSPSRVGRPVAIAAVPTNQTTIVLVMDVSGSMCSNDIAPNRLQAAEEAAAAFIQHQGASTQIGIVAFSGFAEIVQAPTNDSELPCSMRSDSLTTGRRTAIGSGILAADRRHRGGRSERRAEHRPTTARRRAAAGRRRAPTRPDIIVALTDGASNAGPTPLDAAQQAADRGMRVYTIGFGTAERRRARAGCAPAVHRPRAGRRRRSAVVAAASGAVAAASGAASTRTPQAGRRP